MNNKIVKLDIIQHTYTLESCAGCNEPITGEYVEVGLPSIDGSTMEHIALCVSCGEIADNVGVF